MIPSKEASVCRWNSRDESGKRKIGGEIKASFKSLNDLSCPSPQVKGTSLDNKFLNGAETDRDSPKKLWRSVNLLLGRGRPSASSDITVEEFSQFFLDKVNAVRLNTAGASQPSFSVVGLDKSLTSFTPVCTNDVITAIARLPYKSSAADPLPVSLMKQVSGEISPFLTELFNRSLSAGHFPSTFKQAFITPALKKPGLDAANVQSYRPILNLPVVSKLLEWFVAR